MALDEPQTNDVTFTDRGIAFVIEQGLFEEVKPIRVDFTESSAGSGFVLTSSLPTGEGCCSG